MSGSIAERYVRLGLRVGRHVEGIVDAYFGPPEWAAEVEAAAPVEPGVLVAEAQALLEEVDDGWLRDQLAGLRVYTGVLAGESASYPDEVEGCYGVRPSRVPESVYEEVHAELDELLPGEGTLYERRQAWRDRHLVSGDKVVAVTQDLLPVLRTRTNALLELPAGEELTLEPVSDEPWWAFNYYLGNLASRVVLNVDVPTTGLDLVHLVGHEVYPGHHTEHAVKEQVLIRDRGKIEEAIQLVPTPQAVLSEGIAEAGIDVVLDDAGREEAYAVLRSHGLELADPALSERIAKAAERLRTVGLDTALLIHEEGASEAEAQAYVERWSLMSPDQAQHSVSFVTDPTWRAYVITYSAGRDLCRAYIDGDPARLATLLTEHVRIGDLLAAAR